MSHRPVAPLALAGLPLLSLLALPPLAAQSIAPEGVAAQRVAFVTSGTFGTVGGSAAFYDNHCRIAANSAGLDNHLTFIAFVSDSTTDAYCRVQGLTGERASNCGQESLPTGAGPWVRTDGFPFAPRIDLATGEGGQIFAPAMLDENGDALPEGSYYWTGSDDYGAESTGTGKTCSDWGVNDGSYGAVGSVYGTTESWANASAVGCTSAQHLLCLEPGPALPLPPYKSGGAQAFVTSAEGTGKLQGWPERETGVGVEAGDSICRHLAALVGLPAPESFVAWLSDGTVDAKDRLTYDGPWIRLDGVPVASSKSDLVDGSLFTSLNLTETGVYLSNYAVWTGTGSDGLRGGTDCGDWDSESAAHDGDIGVASFADSTWTSAFNPEFACSFNNPRLYCFSDFPAVVFVDGFESGSSAAWDAPVPPV